MIAGELNLLRRLEECVRVYSVAEYNDEVEAALIELSDILDELDALRWAAEGRIT